MSNLEQKLEYIEINNIKGQDFLNLFDFDFFQQDNIFFDLIDFCNINTFELISTSPFFDPNTDNGFYFKYCINNELYYQAKIFLNHPKFIVIKEYALLLIDLMKKEELSIFKLLSKKENIDVSFSENLLLQRSCDHDDNFLFFLLSFNTVLDKLDIDFINNSIPQPKQNIIKSALKIYQF